MSWFLFLSLVFSVFSLLLLDSCFCKNLNYYVVANSKYRNQIQTYNQSNSRPTTVSSNGHQNKKSMTSFYVPASSIQRPRCTPIGFTICQKVDNYPR